MQFYLHFFFNIPRLTEYFILKRYRKLKVSHICQLFLNPGIKPRSPALWADALPSEPPRKPFLRSSLKD